MTTTAVLEKPASRDVATQCSSTTRKLARLDLERSGLSLDGAASAQIFPVDDASTVCRDFATAPALVIPYRDPRGRPITYEKDGVAHPFCRARYLTIPGYPLPRGRKYDQPADSGTPPYFATIYDWSNLEHGEVAACVITEGEKKALALCCAGIPAVAIGGVFNFADHSAGLHPELRDVATRCRDIYIAFDSDAAYKPDIRLAEWRLAGQLALSGARVHIVRIPASGDDKVGVDDYLLEHGAAALQELILSAPPLGDAPALANDNEITVADMLGREVAPVEELIPGWLEKGIPTFLAGVGGVHKSRLAMQWALCLNTGASIWGLDAAVGGLKPAKATMVYCAAEDDANELARRAQAICRALKLKKPDQGVFLPCTDAALVIMRENADAEVRPFYHDLVARLRRIEGHKIVVLDSAYDFVRFAGRAKIDEDAVNYFIKVVLQGICDQTNSTLLIPWHPSQAGSTRESMDGWSVAWNNAPRARLGLKKVDGRADAYALSVTKRNHGPLGQTLNIAFHEGALLPCDALPDDGKAAVLRGICVKAAIEAAEHNVPFNRRDAIPNLVFKQIEQEIGRRPSKLDLKDALEEATRAGELCYLQNSRHRSAGFYPPDAELAKDLAKSARRAAREADDA